MAKAKLINKKVLMGNRDIIKYQLFTHCFINNIKLSYNEVACLALLAKLEVMELSRFCFMATNENIFKTSQTVRNFLNKAEKLGLIIKKGNIKKNIYINPKLNILTDGNILLDYKIYHVTKE
jgi:predicted transcriptional regulator